MARTNILYTPSVPLRPDIAGTRHAISAGHYLAAQSGYRILEAGGNAIDAGIAAGITLGVVECEFVSFAGVAPMLIYNANTREMINICGLGHWPKAASCEYFQKNHGGKIPKGVLRTVVPAAADTYITALERFGTMTFADVAADAIRFANEGFVVDRLKSDRMTAIESTLRGWPTSAAVYMPNGRAPVPGDVLVQKDLGRTLQFLVDQEKASAAKGRAAGLQAARDAFYRGDIAQMIVKFYKEQGGLLAAEDLANFRIAFEPPVSVAYHGVTVHECGPWSQGPMLLQALNLLEGIDLKALGHNSADYLHVLIEAVKLAAADREAYFGDPKFVDVPLDALLAKDYAAKRRKLIDMDRASPGMPSPGNVGRAMPPLDVLLGAGGGAEALPPGHGDRMDTSYVCAVDRWGNVLSCTPSDSCPGVPVTAGTGLIVSPRGSQSWTDPRHPCSVQPGKRPRLTPNPAIAIKPGEWVMPFGTPGGDSQVQVMLQVLLNRVVFDMSPQAACEAARFASHSFPSSFEPHDYHPGSLYLEGRFGPAMGDELTRRGHKVTWWPTFGPETTSSDICAACAVDSNLKTGVKTGGADHRRPAYALGS
ncbi:MAG: gamma-glutamyltransferase family protein [Proteobacteria bacterium]|nr:gamma-glutamyltransferase family protein [Pseudomonadota bacterium]